METSAASLFALLKSNICLNPSALATRNAESGFLTTIFPEPRPPPPPPPPPGGAKNGTPPIIKPGLEIELIDDELLDDDDEDGDEDEDGALLDEKYEELE